MLIAAKESTENQLTNIVHVWTPKVCSLASEYKTIGANK
jgi:hypothetical protein